MSHWTKPAAYIGQMLRDERGRVVCYQEPGDPLQVMLHRQRTARYDRRPA